MMAYSGGDDFPCVVADIGSYATKMGFAGESYPRSYFRTTTAIHRSTSSSGGNNNSRSDANRNSNIVKRSYDFFTRPLGSLDGSGAGNSAGVGAGAGAGAGAANASSSSSDATADGGAAGSGGGGISGGIGGVGGLCDDGEWEVCNPIEPSTGLIYEGRKYSSGTLGAGVGAVPGAGGGTSSSHNSNDVSSNIASANAAISPSKLTSTSTPSTTISSPRSQHESTTTSATLASASMPTGECYTHFLNHLQHGYSTALSSNPSNTPLLLIERSYNPPPIRQKTLEIVFEELGVPATFFARDAVCACYAVGRSTGMVVDVGHHGTVVTPVYEGYVENKGILRSPVGTGMMDDLILEYLDGLYKTKRSRMGSRNNYKLKHPHDYVMPLYQVRDKGHMRRRDPFHTLARLDMVRQCREDGSGAGVASFGYASLHDLVPNTDEQDHENGDDEAEEFQSMPEPSDIYQQYAIAPKTPYKLPDGTMVDIPQVKRFDVAELMFAKNGGKSAAMREEAVRKRRDQLASVIGKGAATGEDGDGDESSTNTSANANINPMIAQMEEMTKRKRGGSRNSPSKKQQTAYISHEKLIAACTPYLQQSSSSLPLSSTSTSALSSSASCMIGELSSSSIPAMICDSVFRCDRDQQAQLLANAILCGGGACLSTSASSSSSVDYKDGNAMPERIREEVEAIVHAHTPNWRVKVLSPGLSERAVCSWLGGSILGSLGSFHEMWITKAEYEEHGTSIVNRKCP